MEIDGRIQKSDHLFKVERKYLLVEEGYVTSNMDGFITLTSIMEFVCLFTIKVC